MQQMARTSSLGTAYTAAQVTAQLTNPTAEYRWVFDRIDADANYVADITPYVQYGSALIDHDTTREVHRQFSAMVRADAKLNWISDSIRVHQQMRMPDGGWVDFVLGTFNCQLPKKTISRGATWRNVQGYDFGVYLTNAEFTDTYTARAGTTYNLALQELLNGTFPGSRQLIIASTATIPTSLSWEAGKTKLSAVNDLLGGMGYNPLWFDESGQARSEPLQDYTTSSPSYVFDTTTVASGSGDLIASPIVETPDLTNAFNQVAVIVEDPQRSPISVVYNNINPLSPTSQANTLPRTTVIRDSTIAGTQQAQTIAKAKAQEFARVYTVVELDTFPWPVSQNLDLYSAIWITQDEGLVQFPYVEVRWVHQCQEGSVTQHYLSRVVPS